MSVASEILRIQQAKQAIKDSINNKGGTLTNETIDNYAQAIDNLPSGSGGSNLLFTDDLELAKQAKEIYNLSSYTSLLNDAWQDMKDSETVLFDIPLALAAPNQEMGGMTIDLYVGTNGQLQALYDACANETIRPPIDSDTVGNYYVNNVATYYVGDISGSVGFPIPLYNFGIFGANDNTSFLIGDLTPLSMGLGLVLAKIVDVPIPNNNIVIQQGFGFKFENESGIIIPESVTSIERNTFRNWTSNNQPLVIPSSVTIIGYGAFDSWKSNNQPLVIPDSVTGIGDVAFGNWFANNQPLTISNSMTEIGEEAFIEWQSNNQPLVIPNSVTSIGDYAFSGWKSNNQPLVIPSSVTSIGDYAFYNWQSNNQPLVIPSSVTSIGDYAFSSWTSNNQPLVIPSSVTIIGYGAFFEWSLVPYIEIQRTTPPTLSNSNAFANQNDAPIYVPDASVASYKSATQWVSLASRIFSINDK